MKRSREELREFYKNELKDNEELIAALRLILDHCDWVNAPVAKNTPVGTAIPEEVLIKAGDALDKIRVDYSEYF